ncbi:tributyrin esterase [Treponema primitia ZAS-2]|uniref:Tributyrin esterase n=1 Tax=Treponema primitia (strain ATCC BAA-887 / DSM 12427 / ZAS-2) TaxID=545694 RepID=F5YL91_TREPZ|nr:alpha/beta hydrolase family protein [Treponema primitia]AEF86787.1 tributyrin esterase [Treponema primitia ZAS-2]
MIVRGNVYSEVLHIETGISVLAPDTHRDKGSCKVVYLFHGLHGDHNSWLDSTMLQTLAKDYNAIFVMPEVGRSFYADMKHGYDYFTYVSEELPEISKKVFNISAKREDTAVMGCSMGGYGALKCALTKPDQYGFCGAISSACLFIDEHLNSLQKNADYWLKTGGPEAEAILRDFYAIFGNDLSYTEGDEIIKLTRKIASRSVKPKIYAACGTEDPLQKENIRFKDQIEKLEWDYTYEEWAGVHDWQFFNDGLNKALQVWYS